MFGACSDVLHNLSEGSVICNFSLFPLDKKLKVFDSGLESQHRTHGVTGCGCYEQLWWELLTAEERPRLYSTGNNLGKDKNVGANVGMERGWQPQKAINNRWGRLGERMAVEGHDARCQAKQRKDADRSCTESGIKPRNFETWHYCAV